MHERSLQKAKTSRKDATKTISQERDPRAERSLRRAISIQLTGNQAMQRMLLKGVQAKLKVSQPGDQYEQEADKIADIVMRMTGSEAHRFFPGIQGFQRDHSSPSINWAYCPNCNNEEKLHRQTLSPSVTPLVEEISRSSVELNSALEVTPKIEHQINSLRDGGQPLSQSERSFFEPRFGHDFSDVRIHTDMNAAESAHEANALAYTIGRDIIFNVGQYMPGTSAGQQLLAHELAHIVQHRVKKETRYISRQTVASRSIQPIPKSEKDTIASAILLFYYSKTSKTSLGNKVLSALFNLYERGELEFEELPKDVYAIYRGPSRTHSSSTNISNNLRNFLGEELIAIQPDYRENVMDTSLHLVHEALHYAIRNEDVLDIDHELAARNLEIDFYEELLLGFTIALDTYKALPGMNPDIEYQKKHRDWNQLVDVIVSLYWDIENLLNANWVERHINDWGGIPNRWLFTKAWYLKALLKDPLNHGYTIIYILETEKNNWEKFFKIVTWVGQRNLIRALRSLTQIIDLNERIERLPIGLYYN